MSLSDAYDCLRSSLLGFVSTRVMWLLVTSCSKTSGEKSMDSNTDSACTLKLVS